MAASPTSSGGWVLVVAGAVVAASVVEVVGSLVGFGTEVTGAADVLAAAELRTVEGKVVATGGATVWANT